MPNWVKTVVKFKKLKKKDDLQIILDMIARPLEERDRMYNPEKTDWTIDFDRIIPEPREESDCPAEYIRTEDDHVGEDPDKPWFNWYKWHCTYWGTKWGACDGYTKSGDTYIAFVFSTPWSVALPVIEKLALLGYNIEVKYADEDLGSNCGKMEYDVNSDKWKCSELENPYRFAKNLWDKY